MVRASTSLIGRVSEESGLGGPDNHHSGEGGKVTGGRWPRFSAVRNGMYNALYIKEREGCEPSVTVPPKPRALSLTDK